MSRFRRPTRPVASVRVGSRVSRQARSNCWSCKRSGSSAWVGAGADPAHAASAQATASPLTARPSLDPIPCRIGASLTGCPGDQPCTATRRAIDARPPSSVQLRWPRQGDVRRPRGQGRIRTNPAHPSEGGSAMYRTDHYEGMLAETVTIQGENGDPINAYFARPLGAGPVPGMVLIHHIPGWDEWYREATRKFAHHGYAAISPNLYHREGHGTPEDVAAKVRADGGVPDDQVVGDVAGALRYLRALPYGNRKTGVFGTCSGGRHAVLAASRLRGFDAAIDCWGGRVVMAPSDLTPKQPVAPIDYTAELGCPLLGLFG